MRFDLWELVAMCALAIALGALAIWGHIRLWVRRLALPLEYVSHERLICEDGGVVELRRVPIPAGVARADLPPMILVHGLAANHRNQDMHPDYSLARFLAGLGRDVWLPTLRCAAPGVLPGHRVRFEAMAKHDVPTVFAAVRERSGAEQIDYVGFSMGGMLIYACLDRSVPRAWVRRLVTVGSPAEVKPRVPVPRIVRFVPWWLVPRVPFRFYARIFAFASEWFTTPFHAWVANPKNMPPGLTKLALVDLIEDIPAGLLYDFILWSTGDGVVRMSNEPILPGLATMDMPALFVAGSADYLAPPSAVHRAFDMWGEGITPDVPKRFFVVGRDFGSAEDYGHGDLALGARVGVELFGPIARFLGPEEQREVEGPKLGAAAVREIDRREALVE